MVPDKPTKFTAITFFCKHTLDDAFIQQSALIQVSGDNFVRIFHRKSATVTIAGRPLCARGGSVCAKLIARFAYTNRSNYILCKFFFFFLLKSVNKHNRGWLIRKIDDVRFDGKVCFFCLFAVTKWEVLSIRYFQKWLNVVMNFVTL